MNFVGLFCRFFLLSVLFSLDPLLAKAPIIEEMGELYQVTTDLLPLVVSKADFENPKNKTAIARKMNRLKALSTIMSNKTKKFEDKDPSIVHLSERFSEDVGYAIKMWNLGDTIVPRRILRNTTDYCIACHTRTGKGADLINLPTPKKFNGLSALTKAEYFAATRQYEKALGAYETVLADRPLARMDPDAWAAAIRRMLAITVRVKNSPSLTLEMISRVQDSPESNVPALARDIAAWRAAAKEWNEASAIKKEIETLPKKLEHIEALLQSAEKNSQSVPNGGLIHYLRASMIAHDLMGDTNLGASAQKLYWLAATAVSGLKEINLWTLQDVYFEQCIRAGGIKSGADKVLTKKCYDSLESAALFEYGVSSKSLLPEHARVRLEQLAPN